MKTHFFSRSVRVVLTALGLAGCVSDSATGPSMPTRPSNALLSDLQQLTTVTRKQALASDITVSATLGSAGGTISIPAAGFTLVVPKGAVSSKTKFSVTAVAGKIVAYEMEPHGMVFAKPLSARQDLKVTWGGLPELHAGYFTDRSLLDQDAGKALVSEVINGTTSLVSQTFDWPIKHFSGYTVAW